MKARVHLPLALRTETGGAGTIEIEGASVREAIAEVATLHPTIRRHLLDETGALRRHVNVFVNEAELRTLGGLDTALDAGDEIHIVPSIAGG